MLDSMLSSKPIVGALHHQAHVIQDYNLITWMFNYMDMILLIYAKKSKSVNSQWRTAFFGPTISPTIQQDGDGRRGRDAVK